MLFDFFLIRSLHLKNRIVLAPMGTNLAEKDGSVSEALVRHYARRAQGGVGLIIVENASVDVSGHFPHGLAIYDDKFIPGLSKLVREVHQAGSKICLQLNHGGRQLPSRLTGFKPVAPSPVASPLLKEIPREMSKEEITQLVEKFGEAANRVKQVGFDAIELHGAHGYLVCQFLSAASNQRQDDYGGGLWERTRFAREIISKIRGKVGSEYPVFFRLSAEEYVPSGLTIKDSIEIARILKESGVDVFHVSAGQYASLEWLVQPMRFPPGVLVSSAASVKKATNVPVIAVGRINDPLLAEKILSEKKADLIAMGRPLLADPDLPWKAQQELYSEIRPCVACNECFRSMFYEQKTICCAVNVEVGREGILKGCELSKAKKIAVVGSGPAGLEAARVAAQRGFSVTLYEASFQMGGKLTAASQVANKKELARLKNFLINEVKRLGVEIKVGKEVYPEELDKLEVDAIIWATGAEPIIPLIDGLGTTDICTAEDILLRRKKAQGKIVILGASGTGCEVAEFLISEGQKTITMMARGTKVGHSIEPVTRRLVVQDLKKWGVQILTGCQIKRLSSEGVFYTRNSNRQEFLPADTIIVARGYHASANLSFIKSQICKTKIISVGDCVEPRGIKEAIYEGAFAVLNL